jgi:hypothetical protein
MIIIGVDFHPEFQQIASVDTDTGEFRQLSVARLETSSAPIFWVETDYTQNPKNTRLTTCADSRC